MDTEIVTGMSKSTRERLEEERGLGGEAGKEY